MGTGTESYSDQTWSENEVCTECSVPSSGVSYPFDPYATNDVKISLRKENSVSGEPLLWLTYPNGYQILFQDLTCRDGVLTGYKYGYHAVMARFVMRQEMNELHLP